MFRLDSRPSPASTTITILAAALMAVGVVMVFSASASLTAPPPTQNVLANSSFRQAMFTFAALVTMLMVGLCPYESWRLRCAESGTNRLSWFQPSVLLALVAIALLVAVLIPGIGEERNGARRWISLGPSALGLGFQPSELAKLSLVVLLAAVAGHIGEGIRRFWTGLLPLILLLGIVCGLVGIEDFGTAALLAVVGGCMLVGAGAKIWHMFLVCLPGVAGLVYLVVSKPYRVTRVLSFLDPYADPQGAGYHQVQSLITIASGDWWGRGLGAGIQKYGYLPESRSDFIFAVICEELGIIGGVAVLALFAILLWNGRIAMLRASSEFGRLIALGATLTIGFQAAMNVAVVTVSVPTKGIGLPFVSAGGSGVILFAVLVGLLVNVARNRGDVAVTAPALSRPPTALELGLPFHGTLAH
ncbi:MAG TPA: putative peptidoglycan glycosyltransferase FtsW [Phycisphaerae bacterium]|nr:putative peptidoglycan glycosyltransferase FtsW [Phycisphaerae bacterium]